MSTAPHRPRGSSLQKFKAASCIQDTAANEHIVSACKERDQTNIKQMFKIRRAGSCVQIWILYALHIHTQGMYALRKGFIYGSVPWLAGRLIRILSRHARHEGGDLC